MPDILLNPEMGGPLRPEGSAPIIAGVELPPNFLPIEDALAIYGLRQELDGYGSSAKEVHSSVADQAWSGNEVASPKPSLAPENPALDVGGEQTIINFREQLNNEMPEWLDNLEDDLRSSELTAAEVEELTQEVLEDAKATFRKIGKWTNDLSKLIKQSADVITSSHKGSREKRRKKKGGKGIDPWWVTKCPKHTGEERWKCATGIGPDRECKHWKGYTLDK